MKSAFLRSAALAAFLAASFSVSAQQTKDRPPTPQPNPNQPGQPPPPPAVVPCPRLDLRGTSAPIVRDGDTVGFMANISGGDTNVQPVISWTVSAGVLKSGQGTRAIEVDSTGAGADRFIIADVWVGGYAADCSLQGRAAVTVAGPATKRDEFGDLAEDKEKERLSEFAAGLSPSHDQAYIIAYAGRNNVRGYARTVLTRMRAAVIAAGMPAQMVATMDGGFREQPTYELWAVPVGAIPPKATPTVNAKDIVFPKPTPVPAKKRP
jgi:hypothetical protein